MESAPKFFGVDSWNNEIMLISKISSEISFTNDFWYDMICKFKDRMVNYLPENVNFKDRLTYAGILCIMSCYYYNLELSNI